jgi:hypothetical protein
MISESGPRYRRIVVQLFPGRVFPQGVAGDVLILCHADAISALTVSDQSQALPLSDPDRNGDVTREVTFQTPALEKFKPYPLEIRLERTTDLDKVSWAKLTDAVRVEVQ